MIKIVKIKKCSKCKIKKSFNLFGKDKRNKSGLGAWCKDCCNKDSKRWRKTNSEKFKQSKIKWNKDHPEKCSTYSKNYSKKYPEKCRQIKVNWYKNNFEHSKLCGINWRINNRERSREIQRKAGKKRRATSKGKLDDLMSFGIWHSLKGNKAGQHWEDLVGWTLEDMQKDFESKYYDGMTWESFAKGGIAIHHIKRKSDFHFKTTKDPEFKACWVLSNLRPMWIKDHRKLHSKGEE